MKSLTLGRALKASSVHGSCVSRSKVAGRGVLKRFQEASTSFHCSISPLWEILVKSWWNPGLPGAAGHVDSCSPSNAAPGMASFALCRGGGEVCGDRVRCSFPYLDKEVTRGLCPWEAAGSFLPAISLVPSGHSCPAPAPAHTLGLWCLQAKCVPSSKINCLW